MIRTEVIGDATLYCGDCREILPELDLFDALVTDPPYGINFAGQPTKWQRRAGQAAEAWDESTPDLSALLPRAMFQIVWGGNYFNLPPSRGWLSWFKPDAPPSMGNVEFAWTNLDQNARQITQSIGETNAERVGHPTQKPLRVMQWCLGFVSGAASIVDPFMGSGTTGVAALKAGKAFTGIEIEPRYFDIACKRISEAWKQPRLFEEPAPKPRQLELISSQAESLGYPAAEAREVVSE